MGLVLPLRVARPASVRGWPPLLVLYGAIFPPGAILITLAFWPMWQDRPLLAMGSELLSLALLAAAILLLDEPGQQAPAVMLLGASALLTVGWLDNWKTGPFPLLSVPASPIGILLASWAMFRYPNSPHEMRTGRKFFSIILCCLLIGELVCIAVSRPAWNGFLSSAWWPALWPHRRLFTVASTVVDLAGIVFAVAYMGLWVRRWRRSHGISRRLATPVAVAASAICLATIAELAADVKSASPAQMNLIYTIESYLQIGVPVAFLVSVMRRRFARTRIVDLLLRLRGPARTASVTSALRAVFEDSELEVFAALPADRDCRWDHGRLMLPIRSSSGEPLAVVAADPSLSAHDDLVRAAMAASSFALENAQLEAALRAQLKEVSESRLRIIEAGVAERRRIERDLHDGAQQRLLGLKIMLAAAESDVTDEPARAVIARIRSELGAVLDELRDLAHGIHPAVLSQFGLEQAIKSMAERHVIPIVVDLPAGRFDDAAELAAYFLIAESVANAVKHSGASHISVRGELSGGTLVIRVTDDGRGGANVNAGSGIRGVTDRVHAIGGEISLESPLGQGTSITVRIPCG
ncbi:MAG TPA: sensor histidine kinase [Streptosporangiaceae bacterium]|nr:sensor histidine kinase [Streptosporangiaceae bacterium]